MSAFYSGKGEVESWWVIIYFAAYDCFKTNNGKTIGSKTALIIYMKHGIISTAVLLTIVLIGTGSTLELL